MSFRTNDLNKSPAARIGAVAREFILKIYTEQRRRKPYIEYPAVPDFKDLEDHLNPYIKREILKYCIEKVLKFSPGDLSKMLRELSEAETEIELREQEQEVG